MKKTSLYEKYPEARMTKFGGWEMPLTFSSINKEHMAVRNKAGIFDVSHMGELYLEGDDALEFMSKHCTMDITESKNMQLKYAHILNEEGGIIDDTIVTRLGEDSCYIVPNAGRTPVIKKWLEEHGGDEFITDISDETVMIALQGPESVDIMKQICEEDVSDMDFFTALPVKINKEVMEVFDKDWPMADTPLIQKSGYTGEDGFEIVLPAESGQVLWEQFLELKEPPTPCGLAARDSLRLEFGFLLSGQDFDESRTTIETGWHKNAVNWDHDFVGKKALEDIKGTDHQLLKGIMMEDRGIPRRGYTVFDSDKKIGQVTSGTRSPVLKKGIALAYLDPGYHEEGTEIQVEIRGNKKKAKVKNPPFL
ncbi:MAG: glycine cleavage system aminomethyltransferase GcvT [Thermoplasmata archaeon]